MPPPLVRSKHKMQSEHLFSCCLVVLVVLLAFVPDFIVALKDVSVSIPQAVKRGSNAQLICNYDMENETLYSVKWYKGRREFYRYTPKENPAMKVFAMTSGLNVERNLSNQSHVVLVAVPLNISGKFTCEISVEAPSFQTAMVSGEMEVVELPEQQAIVTGIQPRYRIGDLVDGNCSIKFSKPAANLTWTINGIVVPPHHIKTYQIEKFEDSSLESVVCAIHFMVTTQHFYKGQMRLKCTASIFDIFKEEIESIIEEDRPRIMASGRSYDVNNYPHEQHSSGDGFEDHNESYLTYYSAADQTSAASNIAPPIFIQILQKNFRCVWRFFDVARKEESRMSKDTFTVTQRNVERVKGNLSAQIQSAFAIVVDAVLAKSDGSISVGTAAVIILAIILSHHSASCQNRDGAAVAFSSAKLPSSNSVKRTCNSSSSISSRKCFYNCTKSIATKGRLRRCATNCQSERNQNGIETDVAGAACQVQLSVVKMPTARAHSAIDCNFFKEKDQILLMTMKRIKMLYHFDIPVC